MYGFAITAPAQNEEKSQLASYRELEDTKDVAFQGIRDVLAEKGIEHERAEHIAAEAEAWLAQVTPGAMARFDRVALEAYDYGAHLFTARIELI